MKLCKDCKHCEPEITDIFFFKETSYTSAKCNHPLGDINLVTGERNFYCSTSRTFTHEDKFCTPDGRYWEPK